MFLGLQYLLGRRGSFPYGLMVKFSLAKISVLVVISDILQTLFLLTFFDFFVHRCSFLRQFKEKLTKKRSQPRQKKSGRLKKMGKIGVLLISAIPYGGGALSGSILATSLKMKKAEAFALIMLGCIVGTGLYYLGFAGIISVLK